MRFARPNIRGITVRILTHALAVLLLMLSACATPHDRSAADQWGQARLKSKLANDPVRGCIDAFGAMDLAIESAESGDAQSVTVPGFPHLRVTRFLAALGQQFLTDQDDAAAFGRWAEWLAQTAIRARRFELANLPFGFHDALSRSLGKRPEVVVVQCTAILLASDRKQADFRKTLAGAVFVADNYIDGLRVIGLYPVSSIPVLIGFESWKASNLPGFRQPPATLKISGKLEFVAPKNGTPPMDAVAVAKMLRRVANNPLNVPRPMGPDLRRLAAAFAPVFAIDVVGGFDRVGVPVLRDHGPPGFDTRTPRVYVQPSWAIINGVPLLQISYLALFSERPPTGGMDILAGKLDGVIWRVTIGSDGRAMIYDSIHPCGCYHLFFPVPPTRLKVQRPDEPAEGTVVPRDAPVLASGQRMVLHISSGNHYLRGLSVSNNKTVRPIAYDLLPMDSLRSLPAPDGGRRSLYGRDGLVAGTERGERWLLWPMGILSPGAMRQWGTHATAFVGRRHFDDPHMIDRAFAR